NVALKTEHDSQGYMLKSLSPKFLKVLHAAHKVAQTEANVLILGESGVGKEVLARYIHHSSQRSDGIFMPVNCYAFSETMIEAELYGHEKGAFTGANELRIGRFEAADNGTLFLDEIGEMPLSSQIKLLRNIENKEIERIGSNKTIRTDFRLICATNKDLKNAIESRTFREDLYYRINTIVLVIPPLRERKEDLPLMIQHFLEVINKDMKTRITGLDDEVMQVLVQYDYPGNVRELKNVIERLLVFSEGPIITMDDLLAHPVIPIVSSPSMSGGAMPDDQSLKAVRNKVEREHIEAVFKQMHGNIELTAKILDISPRQVYNKLNAYKNN
ncbi:MAG TPA: sigma-54 dependent transcriptional regulator, partial [Fusibacter sp.]|nr:sigma-54 dependent transcriptional regulator [Fusibacter sp.]